MSSFNDDELTMEELMEVTAGVKNGKTDEMLDKMSKPELEQFKEVVSKDVELTEDDLDNVMAAIPSAMVDEMVEKNSEMFRKR